MIQSTHWLMMLISLPGLLCLVVSMILVFVNKGNTKGSRLLAACLCCISLLSFERIVMQASLNYNSLVSNFIFGIISFGLPPLAYSYLRLEQKPKGKFTGHDGHKAKQEQYYWLKIFMVAVVILWLLVTIQFILPSGLNLLVSSFVAITISGIVLFLCLYLLFHPRLLYGTSWLVQTLKVDIPAVRTESATLIPDISPSPKSCLSIDQTQKYKQLIKEHFAKSLAFRKRSYAIRDLANETGIPGYLLSLFINQEYGMNFNEMINGYRVEYLTGLLETSFDWESYTLEAIGKMAGFNSRTAFIAAIKKHTGMTPSAFFGRRERDMNAHPIYRVTEMVRDVA